MSFNGLGLNILNAHVSSSDTEDDAEEARLSTISIQVNTPLLITGDNNTVSVDVANNAAKVSQACVAALRQLTAPSGGVPMIDGDGRPRPIMLDVNAEVRVEGTGNVVGDRAILGAAVRKGEEVREKGKKRKADDIKDQEEVGLGAVIQNGLVKLKRERGAEEKSVVEGKRVRFENVRNAMDLDGK